MQSRVKFYVFSFLISGLALCGFSTVTHAKAPDFLIQEDDVVRGDPKAPITILEYSDFTCGFCEKFFHETFPQLLSQYIETGKVRFVYRDFPRSPGGPALHSSQAARCAGQQDAYWPMHDRLFNSGGQLSMDQLKGYAKELGLKGDQFAQCMDNNEFVTDIFKDRMEGGSLGIRGTPAFVLFPTNVPDNPNLILIPGAFPFETFKEQIDKLLNLQTPPAPTS
ncbi:MAG: DsbA family protein [Nitrospira sp.]|nr:DsbA family protein [Nitrospira sp.]MCA9474676.1 DsbA family protein [Nitrospira sp.]MCA9480300.1 DsbA family protein [Nitrospira sp.]